MPYRCYAFHVSDTKCVLYYHDWWYKYKIQQKKDKINIYWIQSISMGYKKTRMYSLFHPNFLGTRSRSNGKKSSMWYADSRTAGCWYKENLTPYWLMKSCIQNHCKFFIPKIFWVFRHYNFDYDIIPGMKNKYFKAISFLQTYHDLYCVLSLIYHVM